MVSDSFANDAAPALALSKDIVKKKKANKLAKLKQSKLAVRREQWLSHVKDKGPEADSSWARSSSPISLVTAEVKISSEKSDLGSKEVDIESSSIHESDLDSFMSSPVGSSNLPGSSCSCASSRCCSVSTVSETEEDGCLDDWETLADALTATEMRPQAPNLEPPPRSTSKTNLTDPRSLSKRSGITVHEKKRKEMNYRPQRNSRAWWIDDVSRPRSLPKLPKQNIQKKNPSRGATTWAWQRVKTEPPSCPICYEDFDQTDSSFHPCPCGFRLCLFCHKRILEADARCPGCRKQYDQIKGDISFKLGDAFVQISRSHSTSKKF